MKVCILGCSLSALTLARALVNQNIYVDLLCKKEKFNLNKSRTIGISKSNVEFFNNDIININNLIWKLKKIEIFSDNLEKEKLLNFENNGKQLFSIVKNYELYETLEKSLIKDKKFKKKKISNKNLSLVKKYEFIINCDYFNDITKKYFSKKIIKEYKSFAYTTTIKHKKISNNTATQIFTKVGPLAFLPISNVETSVVYSVHNLLGTNKVDIDKMIRSNNIKYEIIEINKIDSFELKSLSLRSYYHDNILAFGDLLHRVHPLAGQGFNMTIRDTKILTEIITKRNNLGLPIDSSVSFEFENASKHKNFIFSNGVDLIYEFFNSERKNKSKVLSKSVQFFGKIPYLNKMFTKIADKGILF